MMMGFALVESHSPDADHGYEMLAELCETCVREQYALNFVSPLQMYAARRMAERGDFDGAVAQARTALDELFSSSNLFNCTGGTNTSG